MKSLVEMAKEMGIKPTSDMSEEEYWAVAEKIGRELAKIPTGLDPNDFHEKQHQLYPYDLETEIYNARKFMNRHWRKGALKEAASAMKKHKNNEVFVHSQILGTPLDETSFIHHTSFKIRNDFQERFIADIDLTSPQFPKMIDKLDDFITKYPADFKVTNIHAADRSDTMNIYMCQPITPEIAQELYHILKPCLNETNHDKLDGLDIFEAGHQIKGIKIGPEMNENDLKQKEREQAASDFITRDMPTGLYDIAYKSTRHLTGKSSLGQKMTALQVLDLMYYLVGKEGGNPFYLESYDGKPYTKRIDFEKIPEHENSNQSIWNKLSSLFKKTDKKTPHRSNRNFGNSLLWSDVKVRGQEGVYYGHRINISSFSEEDRNSLKEMLSQYQIQYTERQATTLSADIKPGDLTIRVLDPKSVQILRSMVFKWAEGPGSRPVFKTNAEYEAEERLIQERRISAISLKSDSKQVPGNHLPSRAIKNQGGER